MGTEGKENHLHITRWVDESKRVGIGFQLSDETTCVYFNDDTRISFNPVSNHFHYWEPKIDEESEMVCLNEDKERTFHLSSIPNSLTKKTEILIHFRHYFLYNVNSGHSEQLRADMSKVILEENDNVPPSHYVQRFIRTKHAMTFKISDASVQTNFFDHTKLITHTKENFVVFISSKSVAQFFSMDHFDHSDKLVSTRLRYVRDTVAMMVRIRHHLTPSKSPPKSAPPSKRQKLE